MPEPFSANRHMELTYPLRKSMNPNSWSQMMAMMMNPQYVSAQAICATCHTSDDIAQFEKTFLPWVTAMWELYKSMMIPALWPERGKVMEDTMNSMMSPKEYEKWFNTRQDAIRKFAQNSDPEN